ncbi:MAG: putative serine/threonine protein kinase [uncultured bacterium]|nr:MAG: putative serine/threonine protein kinase [uncultured bacterium]
MPVNKINILDETEKSLTPRKFLEDKQIISQAFISTQELKKDLEMYEIITVLGNGSTGIVYKAKHKKLERYVAIKMLKPEYFENKVILENFRKEAQILSRIKHENVSSVYDFLEINNHFYLVMELVEGDNLACKCQKGISIEEALNIFIGLLEGIRHSHNKKILHLDLKPSNIILNEYQEPVIVDFGVSRFKKSASGKEDSNPIFGTPYYMSPEQYARSIDKVDVRSDIYSLGVVFYQLLTGCMPFEGNSFDELRNKVLFLDPLELRKLNPQIPEDLEAIILKMLMKNPANRYYSAQEVIDDIKRFQRGEPVVAKDYRIATLLWNWVKRNSAISLLTFLFVFVGLTFASYYLHKKYQETPQWKKFFSEDFNKDFFNDWEGYSGLIDYKPDSIKADDFNKNFSNRIGVLGFKKEKDLLLVSKKNYDENLRINFQMSANLNKDSIFGFFINASSVKDNQLGYIIYCSSEGISLIRDKLVIQKKDIIKADYEKRLKSLILWKGDYKFESDNIYDIEFEVIDGSVSLKINNEQILKFHDFITWFSKKDYKFGFFSDFTDLEIDNIKLYQLNTALLITPLDIGNRLFQLGRINEAIEEYSRVIDKYPDNKLAEEAYYYRSLAKMKIKEYFGALDGFNNILIRTANKNLRSKSYYQKGICHLYLNEFSKSFENFNEAIKLYNLPSLQSNIVDVVVNYCHEVLDELTAERIEKARLMMNYLISLNIPYKISFIDIPKTLLLFYFDNGQYAKTIEILDVLIEHYYFRKDVLAFALWKKGRCFHEMANLETGDKKLSERYRKKAILCFNEILKKCPEIKIYVYFSYDELAKLYRSFGDYKKANDCQKKQNSLVDVFY